MPSYWLSVPGRVDFDRFPAGIASTVEHLVVLAFAAEQAPGVLEEVERAAIEGEIEAARSAPITPGVREFLAGCARTDRPVVIVSNNAAAAVEVFLERHDLTHLITGVVGRPYARPELMKPDPFLAAQALALLDRPQCCMVGDAPTDIEFSRRAGLLSIAHAKSPRHEALLHPAGPDAVITAMTALADCL